MCSEVSEEKQRRFVSQPVSPMISKRGGFRGKRGSGRAGPVPERIIKLYFPISDTPLVYSAQYGKATRLHGDGNLTPHIW